MEQIMQCEIQKEGTSGQDYDEFLLGGIVR
jgi:hypothetical protein